MYEDTWNVSCERLKYYMRKQHFPAEVMDAALLVAPWSTAGWMRGIMAPPENLLPVMARLLGVSKNSLGGIAPMETVDIPLLPVRILTALEDVQFRFGPKQCAILTNMTVDDLHIYKSRLEGFCNGPENRCYLKRRDARIAARLVQNVIPCELLFA